jgi:hypothetical protein
MGCLQKGSESPSYPVRDFAGAIGRISTLKLKQLDRAKFGYNSLNAEFPTDTPLYA